MPCWMHSTSAASTRSYKCDVTAHPTTPKAINNRRPPPFGCPCPSGCPASRLVASGARTSQSPYPSEESSDCVPHNALGRRRTRRMPTQPKAHSSQTRTPPHARYLEGPAHCPGHRRTSAFGRCPAQRRHWRGSRSVGPQPYAWRAPNQPSTSLTGESAVRSYRTRAAREGSRPTPPWVHQRRQKSQTRVIGVSRP